MRILTPRRLLAASLGIALCAAQASAMTLIKPSCLDELVKHTATWAECTEQFSRSDARCKTSTAKMDSTMKRCAAKGHSREEINAAMTAGYRKAGVRKRS